MNVNIKQIIEYPKKGIMSKEIIDNEKVNSTLFCMAERTNISDHTSTKQGFVYVTEGEGIFNLKGKEIKMESGVFIYLEKGVVHSIKAVKNTSFLLSLFKNK